MKKSFFDKQAEYYGVIGLGKPSKPFLFSFDTTWSDIMVPSKRCGLKEIACCKYKLNFFFYFKQFFKIKLIDFNFFSDTQPVRPYKIVHISTKWKPGQFDKPAKLRNRRIFINGQFSRKKLIEKINTISFSEAEFILSYFFCFNRSISARTHGTEKSIVRRGDSSIT